MKINCRIISVNVEDQNTYNSVNIFGTAEDEKGKLRYRKRRENIKEFLNNFKNDNFEMKIFDAITPIHFNDDLKKDTLDREVIFENRKFILGKSLWTCHIANYFSHYKIWQMEEDTLIMEDDLILDEVFFENITDIIHEFNKLEDKNKLLYLQSSTPWTPNATVKTFDLLNISENIGRYRGGDISGTSCYFITQDCKKIILENLRAILPCDAYLDSLQKNKIIDYYLPLNVSLMGKLDTKTMLL